MKKVKDVMTAEAIKSCTLDTKLQNVAKTMKDSNRGALPIVDKDNKVIGIVTDRDVALALVAKKEVSTLTVKDAIPKLKAYTVKAEDNITKALQEMRKNKVGRLPVTDKDGKLKGMLSINNLLSHAIEKKEEIGQITSTDENLAKTIKSLFDRNNEPKSIKEKKKLEIEEIEF